MLPSLMPHTWMLALGKFVIIKNVYLPYKAQQRVSIGTICIIIVEQKFSFLHAFFYLMMLYNWMPVPLVHLQPRWLLMVTVQCSSEIIFLQNTGRGDVTSHDITVKINADTSQKETSLTDKRREQIS